MRAIQFSMLSVVVTFLTTAYFFSSRRTQTDAETVFIVVAIIVAIILVLAALAGLAIGIAYLLIYTWGMARQVNRVYPDAQGNFPKDIGVLGNRVTDYNLPVAAQGDLKAWAWWQQTNSKTSMSPKPQIEPEPPKPYLLPATIERDEQAPPLILEARRIAREEM